MSEPTPSPLPPPPSEPVDGARPVGRGRLYAIGVGGALLGAGLGAAGAASLGIGVADFGVEDETARAALYADAACAIAERIDGDDDWFEDAESVRSEPVIWEAPALGYLLTAAAILDPQYEDLREPGQTVISNVARLDVEALVSPALDACAER